MGAVLYEMLTARRPPHRGAAAPGARNRNVPSEVDVIVLKAVAPNAGARFQSAVTLAAELRSVAAILDVRGSIGDEDGPPEDHATSVGRILLLAVVILLALGGVAWWMTAR